MGEKFKYYGIYFAYSDFEVYSEIYPEMQLETRLPIFSRDFAKVRIFDNEKSQIECFLTTDCLEAQLFEANSQEECDEIVDRFKDSFEDEKWLRANIY